MECNKPFANTTFTFVWRIEKFSFLSKWKNLDVSSTEFKSQFLNRSSWCLQIKCDSFVHSTDSDFVFVSLTLLEPNEPCGGLFDGEYSILDVDETPIFTKTVKNCYFSKTADLVLPKGPTKKEIFETKRSEYLPKDSLTIRVRFWKSGEKITDYDEYCFTRTVVGLDKAHNLWNIERFSSLQMNEPLTKCVHFPNYECFALTFKLAGPSLEDSFLNLALSTDFDVACVSFKISVLDTDGTIQKILENQYEFEDHLKDKYLLQIPISRRDILKTENWISKEGVLSLVLDFESLLYRNVEIVYYRPVNLERNIWDFCCTSISEARGRTLPNSEDQSNDHQRKNESTDLSKDFLSLYQEKILCDFELHSGDVSFPVHKSVLCARSPVFRAMISSYMLESDFNFMDVLDLDTDTLNRMLTFLYGGALELDLKVEDAAKLYNAADRYQVQSLRRQCSCIMKSCISTSSVCDILKLADQHDDDELKSHAYEFLLAHVKDVIFSPEWKTFLDENVSLASATMQSLLMLMTMKE